MKRVAVLYGVGKYFFCRRCHDLVYTSQKESRGDRLVRKARKIRRQLNAPESLMEPILFKPKHMHQETFDRLRYESYRADEEYFQVAAERLNGLRCLLNQAVEKMKPFSDAGSD